MSASTRPICEAVIWDFGNVLIGWDPYAAVSSRYGTAQWEDFLERGEFHERNRRADAGIPRATQIDELAMIDETLAAIYGMYVENFELALIPELPANQLVAELHGAGVPQYGLTNWSAEEISIAPSLASGIPLLRDYVVSGRERLIKPDPEIFTLTVERFDLDPGRTLFIDDVAANVDAARGVGLLAHHYLGDVAELRAHLRELGLLPAKG